MNEPERTSGKAVAALVLGLASLGCNFLTAVPALIVGLLALREIGNSEGRVRGRLLALIGLLVAVVSLVCVAPLGGLGGWWGYSLYEKARTTAAERDAEQRAEACRLESKDNLKQIGIALMQYESAYGSFPPAVGGRPGPGQKPVSWRVLVQPFLELDEANGNLAYDFNEPWDGPNNSKLLAKMPKVYAFPGDKKAPAGYTYYQAIVSAPDPRGGPDAAFSAVPGQAVRIPQFTDGLSNTLLIVEAAEPVPWTSPTDLEFKNDGPLPRLGWRFDDSCNVLFADGRVSAVPRSTSQTTLRALITRNGGEIVDPP
jgi:prepilin-type processing-associated H-X9-DG protein